MLVRSSKYFDALVKLHHAEAEALHASAQARQRKVEIDQLRRELQESKDDYLHRLLFKSVIAHLKSEVSIEGVLIAVFDDSVILQHASMPLTAAGDIEQLDGNQVIPRTEIGWVQELALRA